MLGGDDPSIPLKKKTEPKLIKTAHTILASNSEWADESPL